ncbi:MAG: hypothetical protein QXY45_02660 [Candidatus Aenigmatarchaeota archaeon]
MSKILKKSKNGADLIHLGYAQKFQNSQKNPTIIPATIKDKGIFQSLSEILFNIDGWSFKKFIESKIRKKLIQISGNNREGMSIGVIKLAIPTNIKIYGRSPPIVLLPVQKSKDVNVVIKSVVSKIAGSAKEKTIVEITKYSI